MTSLTCSYLLAITSREKLDKGKNKKQKNNGSLWIFLIRRSILEQSFVEIKTFGQSVHKNSPLFGNRSFHPRRLSLSLVMACSAPTR